MIDGNAIQPGSKAAVAAKSRQSLIGFDEDVLRGIFRVGAMRQHANRQIENPRLMADEEEFDGIAVSGLRAAHQFRIGSFGCRCHQNHCNARAVSPRARSAIESRVWNLSLES